ncbi:restriction endonuclease PLD domain-containing protein [Lapidilactobacillus salsurivasis]
MKVLFSNIRPVAVPPNQNTIIEMFNKFVSESDELLIAVGYVSVGGLRELDRVVRNSQVKSITLVIGMYINDGIPESIFNEISSIQEGWQRDNLGCIYMVRNMEYHGKSYTFIRNGNPYATIIGSANLGVIAPDGGSARQYELAVAIREQNIIQSVVEHVSKLIQTSTVSANKLTAFKVRHERIEVLKGYEEVTEITEDEESKYKADETDQVIRIPIKVPAFDRRFSKERKDYAKSNINVCYGKGRKNTATGKIDPRSWYEVQITVDKKIALQEEYPKELPFWIITDDGYKFEAHTTADNYKQLTAYGSDRVFGRWIKGRLETAGYVSGVSNVFDDTQKMGVITKEMLDRAKMRVLVMTKTRMQEYGRVYLRRPPSSSNAKGTLDKTKWTMKLLDVWTVHFEGDK